MTTTKRKNSMEISVSDIFAPLPWIALLVGVGYIAWYLVSQTITDWGHALVSDGLIVAASAAFTGATLILFHRDDY